MKLESQVVSLDLAKRLKELGVRQESAFIWVFDEEHCGLFRADERPSETMADILAAFTVAELGEMLLPYHSYWRLHIGKAADGLWYVNYRNPKQATNGQKAILHSECHASEANARASMLVYLLENGLLSANTVA